MLETLEDIEEAAVKDPMRVASLSAKSQLRKRFYKQATVFSDATTIHIHLDGKPIKTPGGELLSLPNIHVGELVVEEWNRQVERIDPQTMPVTRLINTSIDGVSKDMQPVKDDIIQFAGSDLLCYRADSPDGLVSNQQKYWDSLIEWASSSLGAVFSVQTGIMHVSQAEDCIAAFGQHINPIDSPELLSALHSLTAISGSAIIALAIYKSEIDLAYGWNSAHVDEDWQISQWGEDADAQAFRAARKLEFEAAVQLLGALVD